MRLALWMKVALMVRKRSVFDHSGWSGLAKPLYDSMNWAVWSWKGDSNHE
jgi:hypothetical protein